MTREEGGTSTRGTRPVGARFPRAARPSDQPVEQNAGPSFDLVVRGYHRGQVDEHVAATREELQALQRRCDALKRDVGRASARVAELTAQLDQLRRRVESDSTLPPAGTDTPDEAEPHLPPGPIADKLVRLARREAALVRAKAARDAADMIEAACAEAAAYRRDAEHPVDGVDRSQAPAARPPGPR